ncbi:UNVERIFIED_CONTAM: hypothetical protein Sangu_3095900 [Sesamum angustifolium]|uniref:Protein SirB1 N-terminal domain-containing protein n=1 Tax=Sesamum angustifolium TaxID=2727405 RepID=A0AAW2K795_9LAMI
MLRVSLPGLSNRRMTMMRGGGLGAPMPVAVPSLGNCGRFGFDGRGGCWSDCGKGKRNYMTVNTTQNAAVKKMRLGISPLASSALAEPRNSSRANFYKEVLKAARDKFTREISFQSKDKDISLAKVLLYVAAEDEAFLAFNREIDASTLHNERRDTSSPCDAKCGTTWRLCQWLERIYTSVNKVLFESRGFKRSPVLVDSKCFYLHSVLGSGCASAILLSVIYIEVCRRLNLTIVGSRVGEEFLIWPPTGNPEELFKVTSGHSLFGVVNGKCVDDPRSKASDITSNSLLGLDIATNRDIIGIALANLIRLYWKRASRTNHGLMLTSPLRSVHKSEEKFNKDSGSKMPLLRPQELRLAIMASERLIILQPHNWALRRDYGMMLYYNREYEAAVQELSICMAFAPEEEAEVLEPFVEKLHLMRLETSWKSLGQKGGRLTVP